MRNVGKRFGSRTIVKPAGKNRLGAFAYLVKCDCGREDILTLANTKATTKCRICSKRLTRKSLKIGNRIGPWVVIGEPEFEHKDKLLRVVYLCECECGKKEKIKAVTLMGTKKNVFCRICKSRG